MFSSARPQAGFIRIYKAVLRADSSATPKLPATLLSCDSHFPIFALIYSPPDTSRDTSRDVHYWSIFGVKRAHPEIIALFVSGFTSGTDRRRENR